MTDIEWTDTVWNPVRGCSKVSKGCENCYAMRQAHRFSGPGKPYEGLTKIVRGKGPQWLGIARPVPEMLDRPLRWRAPRRVFVNSMSDLFHEDIPFGFIDRVFAVMAITPWHTYQILTKRPERMAAYSRSRKAAFDNLNSWEHPVQEAIEKIINERSTPEDAGLWGWPLPNVWLGTSTENQETYDGRVAHLQDAPAAIRFLSVEPLLGPIILGDLSGIGWLITGGESGPRARPCNVEWIRSIVGECQESGTAVFVKQLGAHPTDRNDRFTDGQDPLDTDYWPDGVAPPDAYWPMHQGEQCPITLSDNKGGDIEEWPEDLCVREFPLEHVATP